MNSKFKRAQRRYRNLKHRWRYSSCKARNIRVLCGKHNPSKVILVEDFVLSESLEKYIEHKVVIKKYRNGTRSTRVVFNSTKLQELEKQYACNILPLNAYCICSFLMDDFLNRQKFKHRFGLSKIPELFVNPCKPTPTTKVTNDAYRPTT
jgi:hypothetical protein